MTDRNLPSTPPHAWPALSGDRIPVLHSRVVTGTGGGPDKTILLSAPFLDGTPYQAVAAYMHHPDDEGFDAIRRRAAAIDSPLISVPDRGPLDLAVCRRMLKICRHYGVRIWHGHDYKSNLLGLVLRPFHRMKLVTTVHGWVKHTRRTPLYYAADRFSLRFYHHVICVSEDLVERVGGLGVRAGRLTYIPNAIDERPFRRYGLPADAPMRRRLGTPDGRLVLGAMGRLSGEKGFDRLIDAVGELVRDGQDLELWIGGEGDLLGDLRKQVERLDLGDRVRLLGFCEDTIAFYESLDGFVLSSLREGLPNVVLEALAMETPIVSTRVAGVPGTLTDGETGLLCPVADTPALREAIERLVRDDALRRRLAAAGRQLIEARFSFRRRMQRMAEIYDRVLERSSAESDNGVTMD